MPCSALASGPRPTAVGRPRSSSLHSRCQPHCRRTPAPAHAEPGTSSSGAASSSDASKPGSAAAAPWAIGFQCNERYLAWDDSASLALLRIHLARQQALPPEQVDAQLADLAALLPDFAARLPRARADTVLALVADLPALGRALVALREALPGVNVSELAGAAPQLLLAMQPAELAAQLQRLRDALPGVDVGPLVAWEPALLGADMDALLAQLRRLAPAADPVALLAADPGAVLGMEAAGQASSLETDGSGL